MYRKPFLPKLAASALLAALLGACADDGSVAGPAPVAKSAIVSKSPLGGAPGSASIASTPVLQYVSSGPLGRPILMQDDLFGGQIQVVVDSDYTSANGDHCRGFRTRTLDGPLIGKLYHACEIGGGWRLSGVERPVGSGS
jgi:hypothetical protein